MGGKGKVAFALAVCCYVAVAVSASADDANSTPPQVELTAGGQHGVVGPKGGSLAYFSTPLEPASARYGPHSMVSFACLLDGQPASCPYEYQPILVVEPAGPTCRNKVCFGRPTHLPGEELPGPYEGRVPIPDGLASGPHTVTVIATDEDGTDPAPPTVRVYLDRTPPSPPKLLRAPPRVSRQRKPRFRFESTDAEGFPGGGPYKEPFALRLRRLRPPGETLGPSGEPDLLVPREPRCGPRKCTQAAYPAHLRDEGHFAVAVPKRLEPGLYEFVVRAIDLAGNRSAKTRFRFRILGPAVL